MIFLNHQSPGPDQCSGEYISPKSLAYTHSPSTYWPTTPLSSDYFRLYFYLLFWVPPGCPFFSGYDYFLFLGIFSSVHISVYIYIFPVLLACVGVTSLLGFLLWIPTFFFFPIKIWASRRKEWYSFGHFSFLFFPWFGSRGLGYWLARFAGCASDGRLSGLWRGRGGKETWLCDQKSLGSFFSFKLRIVDRLMCLAMWGRQSNSFPRARHVCDVMNWMYVCMCMYSATLFFLSRDQYTFFVISFFSFLLFFFFFSLLFPWNLFFSLFIFFLFSFGVGFGIFSRSAQVPIKQHFKFTNSHCPYCIVYLKGKLPPAIHYRRWSFYFIFWSAVDPGTLYIMLIWCARGRLWASSSVFASEKKKTTDIPIRGRVAVDHER